MTAGHEHDEAAGRRLADEAGRLLRESVAELDAATLARLNRARQCALDEFARRHGRSRWLVSGWQPALGVTAVALLAVAFWLGRGEDVASVADFAAVPEPPGIAMPDDPRGERNQTLDIEVLLAEEQIELLEDLEFFDWVATGLTTPGMSG